MTDEKKLTEKTDQAPSSLPSETQTTLTPDTAEQEETGRIVTHRLLISGFPRKKVCRFCVDQNFDIDYKNSKVLLSFMSEHVKIVPRRISGNCAHHQRQLTRAIKRARVLALIPFVERSALY